MTYRKYFRRAFFLFYYFKRKAIWHSEFLKEKMTEQEKLPNINLQNVNIRNLKVLVDRIDLLKQLPKKKIVAEIGVDKGDYSRIIYETCLPAKLHLIDAWQDQNRYHKGLKANVEAMFNEEISDQKIQIDVGLSTHVLPTFPDGYFDWVYLDTDHTYETTMCELNILSSKVKSNGIIAGHDYSLGNWINGYRYGVIEAVNEFCVKNNWEMIFLTIETDQYNSFAIRRIEK